VLNLIDVTTPEQVRTASLSIKAKLTAALQEGLQPFMTHFGLPVYLLEDSVSSYVVLYKEGCGETGIVYFIDYTFLEQVGLPEGVYVTACRVQYEAEGVKFAQTIIFDVLLSKYRTLFTNTRQIDREKAVWQWTIKTALERNLNVYFLDRRSNPNQLVKMNSESDLLTYRPRIWGDSEAFMRLFAIISLDDLSLPFK